MTALLAASACATIPRASAGVLPGLPGAAALELPSGPGTIRGWLARGRPGGGAVLLLHGIGASAEEMVGRARFLAAAGYSVMLLDFRGHGASPPARPTYGGLESRDARAAVAYLRAELPSERIGVIGVSMGGAATLLGPAPLRVDALVLESVYPTIDDAVRDRLDAWLGGLGRALTSTVLHVLLPRDGVKAADLRPIDRIGALTAPVFVLAGTVDRYTRLPEAEALFARATSPKSFWAVEGAGHEDLHAFAPAEYERRVGGFLRRYLQPG